MYCLDQWFQTGVPSLIRVSLKLLKKDLDTELNIAIKGYQNCFISNIKLYDLSTLHCIFRITRLIGPTSEIQFSNTTIQKRLRTTCLDALTLRTHKRFNIYQVVTKWRVTIKLNSDHVYLYIRMAFVLF